MARVFAMAASMACASACVCSPIPPLPDASFHDAGLRDGGGDTVDSGAPDSGRPIEDAGFDAGALDSGSLDAGPDTTPPTFAIVVMNPGHPATTLLSSWDLHEPVTEWKVDEVPLVEVRWFDSDVDPSSVYLTASPAVDGGAVALGTGVSRSSACSCDAGCQCFSIDPDALDLNNPSLGGLWVTFALNAGGSDLAGNGSSAPKVNLQVTRYRWQMFPWQSQPAQVVPALDTSGNLYLGTSDGVMSLTPSATVRWVNTDAGVGATDTMFVGSSDGGGIVVVTKPGGLWALSASNGHHLYQCSFSGGLVRGPPVYLQIGSRGVAATFVSGSVGIEELLTVSFDRNTFSGWLCDSHGTPFSATGAATIALNSTLCAAAFGGAVAYADIIDGGYTLVDAGSRVLGLAAAPFAGSWRVIGVTDEPANVLFVLSSDHAAVDYAAPIHPSGATGSSTATSTLRWRSTATVSTAEGGRCTTWISSAT